MTTYVFETMSDADAAAFTANDYLVFITSSTSARSVTVAPFSGNGNGTSIDPTGTGITLSSGSISHVFTNALATASQMNGNHIVFNDQSRLVIGSNNGSDDLNGTSTANGSGTVFYGLGGSDTIHLGAGPDYAYGGLGADTITGQDGNYHIYGNAIGAPVDDTTGLNDMDTITVGAGSSYIQGNFGQDMITVGTDDSHGYNRVFGGKDTDTITLNGGQGSIAAVNGNAGEDVIVDDSDGANTLRGGRDDDDISQMGASRDTIMGDLGSDTIHVSGAMGHVALITGGEGEDVFDFSENGAGHVAFLNSKGGPAENGTPFYQEITDFTSGIDHIELANKPMGGDGVGHATTIFASVGEAETFAQTQLSGTTTVSSLAVGSASNTYLFYHDGGNSDANLGVIHLDGVTASAVVSSDFSEMMAA